MDFGVTFASFVCWEIQYSYWTSLSQEVQTIARDAVDVCKALMNVRGNIEMVGTRAVLLRWGTRSYRVVSFLWGWYALLGFLLTGCAQCEKHTRPREPRVLIRWTVSDWLKTPRRPKKKGDVGVSGCVKRLYVLRDWVTIFSPTSGSILHSLRGRVSLYSLILALFTPSSVCSCDNSVFTCYSYLFPPCDCCALPR